MNKRFYKSLKLVTIIHVGVLIVILVMSGWHRLFGAKTEAHVIPVEFVVEVPASAAPETRVVSDAPDPSPPTPQRQPRKRPEIKVSERRIRKDGGSRRKPTLSEEQIRKLLAQGAKAGDHTSIPPDEETRCLAIIRQAVQPIWEQHQPSRDTVGDAVVAIEFKIGSGGMVTGRRVLRASGVATLDRAALAAAAKVKRFRGLTASFIRKHPTYPVNFTAKPR
jgi:TonB family protein